MRKFIQRNVAVAICLIAFGATAWSLAWGENTVKANQGAPGTQGAWPVVLSGSSTDGGSVPIVSAPCTGLAQIITDAGTVAVTVPVGGPTANRIWIQVCNTLLNTSTAQCICASNSKPSFSAAAAGDVLAVGDCATYNITAQDGGNPWCVCNASNVSLNSTECIP